MRPYLEVVRVHPGDRPLPGAADADLAGHLDQEEQQHERGVHFFPTMARYTFLFST